PRQKGASHHSREFGHPTKGGQIRVCRPMSLRKASADRYRLGPSSAGCGEEGGAGVNELVEYLLSNLQLDFSGDVSAEKVREYLREDDGREARKVLARVIEENGVDDLLITLADCLKDHIRTGITADHVRDQLSLYTES